MLRWVVARAPVPLGDAGRRLPAERGVPPLPAPAAAQVERVAEAATEAVSKKRTLTNLDHARPAWLAHLHAALDRAVWAAYGWDDPDPGAVPEDAILARLLALNLTRSGA